MQMKIGRTAAALIAGAAFATAVIGAASADEATDFFKGRTINIVVGFGSGGGYGHYCQQLVQYWGDHTPGKPKFICQYMSGAGGVKAANYMYHAAPKDGSYVSMLSDYGAVAQLLEPHTVKYDYRKFKWVGIMVPSNPAMMVRAGQRLRTKRAPSVGRKTRASAISASISADAQPSNGDGCAGISARSAARSAERSKAAMRGGPSMTM